jgi:hypothetical protein
MKTGIKTKTTKPSPKTKMKKRASAASTAARKNVLTASRLRSIEDVMETRGVITKQTDNMITVKLSKDIIDKLKDVYLTSQRDKSEYVGIINLRRYGDLVEFNTPTRHTNWQPMMVMPPAGTNENLIVYHSHPVPVSRNISVSTVTLPSKEDFTYYVRGYPKMQANIILERNGYYMIDLLESNNFKLPNPSAAYDTFMNLLINKDIEKYAVRYDPVPIAIFSVSIASWQKMFNTYIDKVMRHRYGMSIKYYRYSERPEITLVNPATVVPIRSS